MSSAVTCGLPILRPFALAFAIPERTLSRIIRNSNSANTPLICIKALVIGSICPLEQSTHILPTMDSRKHFSLTVSIISQSCLVLLARRETSSVMMVSPACAVSKSVYNCSFTALSPCSYSRNICSAPAAFSSLVCR